MKNETEMQIKRMTTADVCSETVNKLKKPRIDIKYR